MTDALPTAEEFLRQLFRTLDRGDFAAVAELLTDDVQLADELAGGWIRGRSGVSAYLMRQTGIVTDVRSQLSGVAASRLSEVVALVTFALRQDYRLGAEDRGEDLLGTALLDMTDPQAPNLRLLHLGPARAAAL